MKAIAILFIAVIAAIVIMAIVLTYLYRCYDSATEALIRANRRIRKLENEIGIVSDNAIESIDKEETERRHDFFDLNFRLNRIEEALHVPPRIEEIVRRENQYVHGKSK